MQVHQRVQCSIQVLPWVSRRAEQGARKRGVSNHWARWMEILGGYQGVYAKMGVSIYGGTYYLVIFHIAMDFVTSHSSINGPLPRAMLVYRRVPPRKLVCNGKANLKRMIWGYPHLRRPPYPIDLTRSIVVGIVHGNVLTTLNIDNHGQVIE